MYQLNPAAPSPPFARHVSPGSGALANLAWPGDQALANPGGISRAFNTHVVSSKTWKISEVKISDLRRIDLSSKG